MWKAATPSGKVGIYLIENAPIDPSMNPPSHITGCNYIHEVLDFLPGYAARGPEFDREGWVFFLERILRDGFHHSQGSKDGLYYLAL